MIRNRPSTGDHTGSPAPVRRLAGRLAPVAVVLAGTIALGAPGTASAASRPCPKAGKTLLTSRTDEGSSRVWRTRGRIYGCTTIENLSGRPDSFLLSRKVVGRLTLNGDTVAFTQHATGTPKTARRITVVDLKRGARTLDRRRAVPADDDGTPEREGSVEQLRVLTGGYVGWIANGSTVVVGSDDEPGDVVIAGEDEATGSIYLSAVEDALAGGYAGVAGRYPSGPEVTRSLRTSLAIEDTGSDPDDDGSYEITWSWSPDGATTVRAVMSGRH